VKEASPGFPFHWDHASHSEMISFRKSHTSCPLPSQHQESIVSSIRSFFSTNRHQRSYYVQNQDQSTFSRVTVKSPPRRWSRPHMRSSAMLYVVLPRGSALPSSKLSFMGGFPCFQGNLTAGVQCMVYDRHSRATRGFALPCYQPV
jgi:hypothetical protein